MYEKVEKSYLEFSDGIRFEGYSFGAWGSAAGEVVFHTAMVGYPESLTDPSYKGQILVLTYPLVGNYGVPEEKNNTPFHSCWESEKIHISGLIISDYSFAHSHHSAKLSLQQWLKKNNVPALMNVDTRKLTQYLRNNGSAPGRIINNNQLVDFQQYDSIHFVEQVSVKHKTIIGEGSHKIVLVDCGVKNNIIRHLLDRDCQIIRVPWDYDFHKETCDGIMLSNGPGNPDCCEKTIQNVSLALKNEIPVMGICLGNQLLGKAVGFQTSKLKFGHRSYNQPVMNTENKRCYITSQNHSFAIEENPKISDWAVAYKNNNDGTCEGIKHKSKPFFAYQFHPEAAGGPQDTRFLFDDFISTVHTLKS